MALQDDYTSRHPEEADAAVRQLNSLLRGELSAVETYQMAIHKIASSDNPHVASDPEMLREMLDEHGRAAELLRQRIESLGGEASDSSGAWGTFAAGVQATRDLLGDSSALKGLKDGEQHGLKDYEDAVGEVDDASAAIIRSQLIPAQQQHVRTLDHLIATADRP